MTVSRKIGSAALPLAEVACYITDAARPSGAGHIGAGWSSPVARQAHNLKVVGSNPTPATNIKAHNANALAGFFTRRFAELALLSVIPPNAIKINALSRRAIVYRRVHVTCSAHENAISVRQAFFATL